MRQNLSSGIHDVSDFIVREGPGLSSHTHTQLPAFLVIYQGLTCQEALSKVSDGLGIR